LRGGRSRRVSSGGPFGSAIRLGRLGCGRLAHLSEPARPAAIAHAAGWDQLSAPPRSAGRAARTFWSGGSLADVPFCVAVAVGRCRSGRALWTRLWWTRRARHDLAHRGRRTTPFRVLRAMPAALSYRPCQLAVWALSVPGPRWVRARSMSAAGWHRSDVELRSPGWSADRRHGAFRTGRHC